MSGQISVLTRQNTEQSHTVTQLSSQNIELSNELAKATGSLIGNITGGDSYCELVISPIGDGAASFVLVQHGNYPLYNVNVRVVDLDNINAVPKVNPTMQDVLNLGPNFTVNEIARSSAAPLGQTNLNFNKETKSFNIFFAARNGFFNQFTSMFKIDGAWKSSTIVKTMEGKVLYEKHDPALKKEQYAQ